jgi:hypothetical protein
MPIRQLTNRQLLQIVCISAALQFNRKERGDRKALFKKALCGLRALCG